MASLTNTVRANKGGRSRVFWRMLNDINTAEFWRPVFSLIVVVEVVVIVEIIVILGEVVVAVVAVPKIF